jgi:hypothetical protein
MVEKDWFGKPNDDNDAVLECCSIKFPNTKALETILCTRITDVTGLLPTGSQVHSRQVNST